MSLVRNKRFQISLLMLALTLVMLMVVFVTCGKEPNDNDENKAGNGSEGFTFLDLGENTEFSDAVRDSLREQLGSDAIEKKIPLDLSVNYKGFLKSHLPSIYDLNRKLNSPLGERIEHNIIKLRYRYAKKKGVPFEYVELIFSGYTKKPLVFHIEANKDGAGIVDVITKKFGMPKEIVWETEEGKSLLWQKNESVLIISIKNDRFGNPEYQTTIYYVPSLESLILKEQQEAQQREEAIKKTGKTAF